MKSLLEEISYFLWLFTWWGLLADLPLHRFALAFFIRTLKRLDNQAFCPFLIKAVNLYISANVLSPILQHVPQPPIFCFLVCKVVVCIKALMHEDNAYALFFWEESRGGVLRGRRGAIFKRRTVGWVGGDLSCSRLLSSPLPARTTLLLCSARGVSGTIHSLISMWHSRLETPLGVGSRYAFLHQTSCIFSSSSISKPPLTLVNKTCMNPMTEYNLGKDRIQDKMPGEILPACTLTSEVCSQNA